jgi:hypothetical protein
MAVDDAPPLVVIGMEGLWGSVIMLLLAAPLYYLPGRDKGSIEDSFDTLVMIQNSSAIRVMLVAFFVTITTYNIFCIYVTAYLSAIWHAILDNFRPVSGEQLLIMIYMLSIVCSSAVSLALYQRVAYRKLLRCLLARQSCQAALRESQLQYATAVCTVTACCSSVQRAQLSWHHVVQAQCRCDATLNIAMLLSNHRSSHSFDLQLMLSTAQHICTLVSVIYVQSASACIC